MTSPPNVLLIAYACEPGRGSEWGTSWAFVRELSEHQPVWVLAHADNRERLDGHLASHATRHPIHVRYVALGGWLGWMRRSWYALHNVHYYLWQLKAGRVARAWHDEVGFDVAQHVSYSRWWMPSAGAALARRGVRFIFGPCVGGEGMPRSFRTRVPWRAAWGELQRRVARAVWTRDPLLARCVRDADLVVAGTPTSVEGVRRLRPRRLEVLPCVMVTDTTLIDAARPHRAARDPRDPTFRLVSVGGVVYHRGIDLILRAIKASGIERFHYTHCCGGDALDAMRRLAADLGLADRVTFTGETRQAENLVHVARSDVMLHLVLRDSQGVVPEALALGVPVIALDHHSMSATIDGTVGHKVPMGPDATAERVIADVATTLRRWHDDRSLLAPMSAACVARSRQFSPQYRVGLFRAWHAEVLSGRAAPTPADGPVALQATAA